MPTMRHLRSLVGKRRYPKDTEHLLSDLTVSDVPQDRTAPVTKSSPKYLDGWRSSVILFIILGVSIFSLNLGVTIWASSSFPVIRGVATVYEGSCSKTKNSITWLHLAINILGTLLLSASNFCMQILCSPTRKEVDAAHARQRWLSIGVPSLKNLFYVGRTKSALWILLGLSSIPLHLLWNSAFVHTLSSNTYIFNAVTEEFLTGHITGNASIGLTDYLDEAKDILGQYENSSLISMSVAECMEAYRVTFNSHYGNLILVYDTQSKMGNNSLLLQGRNTGNNNGDGPTLSGGGLWMCGFIDNVDCNTKALIQNNATHWNPWNGLDLSPGAFGGSSERTDPFYIAGNIKSCFAEPSNRPCRIGISIPILITVLICNAVKTIGFTLTLYVCRSMNPLVTNGDAVASFLSRPDRRLKGRCLVSKTDVGMKKKQFWSEQPLLLKWRNSRRRWAAGAAKGFWLATFLPGMIFIITVVGIVQSNGIWTGGAKALASNGFGRPSTQDLVGAGVDAPQPSLASAALLANTPQIIVSYIYVAYNGLFTCMLSTAEWVGYSARRQGLRVAWPKGQQRARRFLQIPYRYGVPIMVASTLLHWLISQSFFLVRITVYDYDGTESIDGSVSSVGYSPLAIVFALSMGGAMLVAVLLLGSLRTYPGSMPLAACCSASIAAACQPQEDMAKDELTLEKLQWGVIDGGTLIDGYDQVGHASFSAKEVSPLIAGRTYA